MNILVKRLKLIPSVSFVIGLAWAITFSHSFTPFWTWSLLEQFLLGVYFVSIFTGLAYGVIFFLSCYRINYFSWKNNLVWTIISLFIGGLLTIVIPISTSPPQPTTLHTLEIIATGEKNSGALGNEIWVKAQWATGALLPIDQIEQLGSWEVRNGILLSYQNQPSFLHWQGLTSNDLILTFVSHSWSGIVEIHWDGQMQKLDLYQAEPTQRVITVPYQITPEPFPIWMVIGLYGTYSLSLGACVFIVGSLLLSNRFDISKLEVYSSKNSTALIAIIALSAVFVWLWFYSRTRFTFEDALITYRYAQNIALGNGFVYNLNEKVMGTTTPLFTLILAAVSKIVGIDQVFNVSIFITILAGVVAGWLLYATLIQSNISQYIAILAILIFYFHPDMIWVVTGGMETALVLLLMMVGLYSIVTNRYNLATIAAALLIMARIDGVVWSGLIFVTIIIKNKLQAYKILWPAIVILGLWVSFAFLYFGSPIPHSVIAKSTIHNEYNIYDIFQAKLFLQWYLSAFMIQDVDLFFTLYVWLFFVGISVLWSVFYVENRMLISFVNIYLLLFGILFYLGRAPRGFPWYLTPVTLSSIISGVIGLHYFFEIISSISQSYFVKQAIQLLFYGITSSLVLIFMCQTWGHISPFTNDNYFLKFQTNEEFTRRPLGEWLRDNTPEKATVAMEAIGYQGFYSERKVIDMAGLISPKIVELKKGSTNNADLFYKILSYIKPDYIVLRSYEVEENLHFDGDGDGGVLFETQTQKVYFLDHYQAVKYFSAPYPEIWGKLSRLTIYRRLLD